MVAKSLRAFLTKGAACRTPPLTDSRNERPSYKNANDARAERPDPARPEHDRPQAKKGFRLFSRMSWNLHYATASFPRMMRKKICVLEGTSRSKASPPQWAAGGRSEWRQKSDGIKRFLGTEGTPYRSLGRWPDARAREAAICMIAARIDRHSARFLHRRCGRDFF